MPTIALVLEKQFVFTRTSFIEKQDILSSNQYCFTAGWDTQKALDDLSGVRNNAIDHNEFACSVFLDVSKAFDSVNHDVMLEKLHQYGFSGPFLSLLENYIRNRRQNVVLGKITSSPQVLQSGVPQGSILAPLLFNF